jgi:hypothetical protein
MATAVERWRWSQSRTKRDTLQAPSRLVDKPRGQGNKQWVCAAQSFVAKATKIWKLWLPTALNNSGRQSSEATGMSVNSKAPTNRRSGQDRRQAMGDCPTPNERRVTIEPRQPEVVEIQVSPEEFQALGFSKPQPDAD